MDNLFTITSIFGRAEVIVIILLFMILKKRFLEFRLLLLSSVITAIIVVTLKIVMAAPRPASMLDNVHLLQPYYRMSFPSGDSAVASIVLVFFFNRSNLPFRILLVVYWIIICYGRIYMGVHFPLDVLAGFLISLISMHVAKSVLGSHMLKTLKNIFSKQNVS
ncbi:MAG: phosphatase PAP2 family protein [Deltaproteobacteria bacterium]|nr:phosphatase PAP2 family protein [Deltaproteobacteria bacterium]